MFEKVGVAASAVGISYREIAAATSLLSSTFADAGQVGQGLSLLITKMAKQKDEFNPAVVGMQKALKNLADAHLSYTEIVGMVGAKGAQVVQALIQQQEAFDKLTVSMQNTQAAEEMFGVKSEDLGEVINRIKTLWENFLLKVGESQVFRTIMGIISDICNWIEQLSKDIQEIFSQNGDGFVRIWEQLREVISSLLPIIGAVLKVFLSLYNTFLNKIGTLVDLISKWIDTVYNGIVGFCNKVQKVFEGLYKGVTTIWRFLYAFLGDTKIMQNIVKAYQWLKNKVIEILTTIAKKWNEFVGGFGLNELKINISGDGKPQQTNYDNSDSGVGVGAPPLPPTPTITPTPTGGKGGTGGGTTPKQTYDDNSIEWYNQQIKEQEELLKSKVQTEEDERKTIATILRLEKERAELIRRQENQRKWQEEVAKIASGEGNNTSTELFMTQLPDLSKIKPEPIEVPIKPNLKNKDWKKDITDAAGAIGDAISALGAAFGGAGEDALAFAAQTIQAIGQVIPQIVALIGVKESEATASGTASAAALPFPANLGAIATIVATIASIFAGLPKFADGGIVGGGSYSNDKILARLSSGEMVLNRRQQSNLFNALDRGISLENGGNVTTQIVKIKGSDLYLALNNYNKITGKKL